jgi:hypothetical protein
MKLRGNRIYLEIPKREESIIELTPELEESRIKEEMKKYSKLKVYALGELVTDINVGDEVLVIPDALVKAPIIPLSDELNVLLVSNFDVVMVWD